MAIESTFYATESDWNNVQKILAATAGRPDQFSVTANWGSLLPQLGQFQLARTTLLRAADQAATLKRRTPRPAPCSPPPTQAGWSIDASTPSQTVKHALQLDKGKVTLIAAATTLALCNEEKQANQMLSDLEKHYPEDTLIRELTVPQARAWLALKAGDAQQALVLLERVRAHDTASFAPYLRGLAYLQLKDARNAIASFQDATRLKGAAYNTGSPYALSFLGLGRAYALGW